MRASEIMSRDVRVVRPDDSIRQAAEIMAAIDTGAVPVADDDQLVGMITDRDIAVRAVAVGKGPDAAVSEAMTRGVKYCYEDEDLQQIFENLGEQQIRRLPVVNRNKRLVGILSLGDLAAQGRDGLAGSALAEISRPGGQNSQARM